MLYRKISTGICKLKNQDTVTLMSFWDACRNDFRSKTDDRKDLLDASHYPRYLGIIKNSVVQ